jgi:hypothetical protein
MSTDTAFALGALALVGAGVPDRVRTYLLTFAIVDDVAGIVIIAFAYGGHINLAALAVGAVSSRRSSSRAPAGSATVPSTWRSAWRPGLRCSSPAWTR